jgi:hypothetical protein
MKIFEPGTRVSDSSNAAREGDIVTFDTRAGLYTVSFDGEEDVVSLAPSAVTFVAAAQSLFLQQGKANMGTSRLSCTISCTYGWHPGHGVLASLRDSGEDVGYSRQEVTGTADDFRLAVEAAKAERATAKGSHKTALTRLIQRLEGAC